MQAFENKIESTVGDISLVYRSGNGWCLYARRRYTTQMASSIVMHDALVAWRQAEGYKCYIHAARL
jgi:hypothetical protein